MTWGRENALLEEQLLVPLELAEEGAASVRRHLRHFADVLDHRLELLTDVEAGEDLEGNSG